MANTKRKFSMRDKITVAVDKTEKETFWSEATKRKYLPSELIRDYMRRTVEEWQVEGR